MILRFFYRDNILHIIISCKFYCDRNNIISSRDDRLIKGQIMYSKNTYITSSSTNIFINLID